MVKSPLVALLAASCLLLSTPPVAFPGAQLLVFVGWGLVYAAVSAQVRVWRFVYLVGFVHMLTLSWSLRHISVAAPVAIALLGAVYPMLAVFLARRAGESAVTRRWPRIVPVPASLAFGIGLAFAHWLRAHMPEILYPHGQPIHGFYQWPTCMAPVALGGEFLGNLLVGAMAAACVDLWRCWRTARPGWASAILALVWPLLVWGASALFVLITTPTPGSDGPLDVLLVEPGFGPHFDLATGNDGRTFEELHRHVTQLHEERLVHPTAKVAGPSASRPPDLVVWPENGWIRVRVDQPGLAGQLLEFHEWFALHHRTRLLTGASLYCGPEGDQVRMGTVMVVDGGRITQHQEKLHTVPLGESLPFAGLMPDALRQAVTDWVQDTMGSAPVVLPGRPRPPMTLPSGIRLGTMLCYDNAFPSAARLQVAAGARLLVVLSNESWYLGGAELEQMVAMSVCRALETRTPLVRSTFDGVTMFVDGNGRVLGRLPGAPLPSRVARTLRISVPLGPGHMPPLSWLHWLLMGFSLLVVLPLFGRSLQK